MKAFNQFIVDVNTGADNTHLSADIAELLKTVQATGRAGSLNIKIKVTPSGKDRQSVDKVTIQIDRSLNLPKPESEKDFFFVTDDGDLTRHHPRQQALDLKDINLQGGVASATLKVLAA